MRENRANHKQSIIKRVMRLTRNQSGKPFPLDSEDKSCLYHVINFFEQEKLVWLQQVVSPILARRSLD
jgi:hypothetical protein